MRVLKVFKKIILVLTILLFVGGCVYLPEDINCPEGYVANSLINDHDDLNINCIALNSLSLPMGEIYMFNNTGVTIIPGTNIWVLANGTTENGILDEFSSPANMTLQYTGNLSRHCHVASTFSISGVASNDIVQVSIHLNDVVLNNSIVETKLSGAGDIISSAIHVAPLLNQYDNLTLYIRNINNGDNFVVKHMNLFATCINPH